MNTGDFGADLARIVEGIGVVAPPKTLLFTVGLEMEEMAEAYLHDGEEFFRMQDLANAHAAFTYGFGWLCAGVILGYLVSGEEIREELPLFSRPHGEGEKKLVEKTLRYQQFLALALDAICPAPDHASVAYRMADLVRRRAEAMYTRGSGQVEESDFLNALGSFSCGHGWLDAGVRAGLFQIAGSRHLFTI
ncbi:MAG: DUF357 domain-containing protein [Methanomicrobiaceae archaeon]|nr:DUF357 domain-containing protein [Methanomicrobiaceae archaeon]